VRVVETADGSFAYVDGLTIADADNDTALQDVFVDGKLLINETFSGIRNRLANKLLQLR